MIENLRKYTGLIIVIFVLVIIGFIFMDTSSIRASRGGAPVMKIEGRNYTDKEFNNLGTSSYELTQSLMQYGDFQFYSFLIGLAGNAQSQDQAKENFFVNRILLRSAKEEFGIYPGDNEIDTFIRQLRAFTGPDGAFSQEAYRNFIEKGIGRLGLTETDIRELASDVITHRELNKILGSGLTSDRKIVAKGIAIQNQRIRTNVARIDIDPIQEKIDPSEEEIKTYWETVQDAFKTEEKRKFAYIVAKPDMPEELPEIAPLAEDATEEQKAEYDKNVADREATVADASRIAQMDNEGMVDDFLFKLETKEELTFEELVKGEGWELKTTELFGKSETPEDLKATLRSSEGTAVDELFRMIVTSDPFSKISPPIAVEENMWIIAKLEDTEKSRTQTYEEARDEARARLIAEKAASALKIAADAAAESIKASLAEGKTFAEAAIAAGIENEAVNLPEVTSSSQLDTTKVPASLFDAAKHTTPGEFTEPVIESDRAFIVQVETREVITGENAEAELDGAVDNAANSNQTFAFVSWLNAKYEAAEVQQLNRR